MSNITLTSGDNDSAAELEHAVGPNWREPFVPKESGGESAANEAEAPETQETEQTAAASEPAEKQQESKPKSKAQRAIDKLTAKNYQLAKDLEEARKAKPAEQPAATKAPAGPPQLKDFQTPEEWADARDAWKEARAAEAEAQQERQAELDEYNRGVSELQATKDDWDEVVAHSDIQIREYVSAAIVEMGKSGPEVAYYLATHPEVCEELNDMKKFAAIAKVHEIAKSLKVPASSPQPKPRVAPPAPIKTVGAASTRSSAPIDDDSVPVSEFIKIRNKQEAARRRG